MIPPMLMMMLHGSRAVFEVSVFDFDEAVQSDPFAEAAFLDSMDDQVRG